ncbi:hypothetical protein ABZ379_44590 [Streptomyces canus]
MMKKLVNDKEDASAVANEWLTKAGIGADRFANAKAAIADE